MKFLFNQTPKQETKPLKILPSDVRYALEHNAGKIKPEDIETLTHSHFIPEATYALTKGLEKIEVSHFEYLENLVQIYSKNLDMPEREKAIKDLNDTYMQKVDKNQEIDVVKLAQISRQGFDLWQEKYKDIAKNLVQENKQIFLLANSTIIGLEHFVREYAKAKKPLSIIFPNYIESEKETIGYQYDFGDEIQTTKLNRDFKRPRESIILDDTKNTGETFNDIEKFWQSSENEKLSFKTIVEKTS